MPTPLLTIASAGINLGDRWLLRNADLTLHAGDRLAQINAAYDSMMRSRRFSGAPTGAAG